MSIEILFDKLLWQQNIFLNSKLLSLSYQRRTMCFKLCPHTNVFYGQFGVITIQREVALTLYWEALREWSGSDWLTFWVIDLSEN